MIDAAAPDALVISLSPGRLRAALLEGGETVELLTADETNATRVGEIHRARVTSLEPSTGDVFLQLADGATAFLGAESRGGTRLSVGDGVLIQITRDAQGGKALGATMAVELGGRLLILTPSHGAAGEGDGHAISRRITSKPTRERLRRWIDEAALPGEHWRLRTDAAAATPEALALELARLRAAAERHEPQGSPALLVPAPDGLRDALESLAEPREGRPVPREIWIDDGAGFARARAWCAERAPHLIERLRRADPADRLFERLGIADAIAEALGREVSVPGGGRLVFDTTAALTSIDVDRVGRLGTAFEVNRAVLATLARQVRLRGLQGLIVIDFLRMEAAGERARLATGLAEALGGDAAALHGFTKGGLFEITRPRGRLGLAGLQGVCAPCRGGGRAPHPRHLALEALDRLVRDGATVLRVAPTLAAALDRLPVARAEAALRLGRAVTILSDPALSPDRHEIER